MGNDFSMTPSSSTVDGIIQPSDMQALLDNVPALTDEETLGMYRRARDQVLAAIAAGQSVIEFEIRNRRVQYNNAQELLEFLEGCITRYEQATALNRRRPSRNRVRLRKCD